MTDAEAKVGDGTPEPDTRALPKGLAAAPIAPDTTDMDDAPLALVANDVYVTYRTEVDQALPFRVMHSGRITYALHPAGPVCALQVRLCR